MMVRRPSTFGELISLRRTMDRAPHDPLFPMPMSRQTRRTALVTTDSEATPGSDTATARPAASSPRDA